ncbi:hypothetical protein KFK09_009182 [Dendrobium nobile]|uniref:RRM domain-containing protein n=1 Tax=Dendrobium nobile TaxID=94219 RepID=A0A8T3BRN9_DENNO|nr:hypothetical protein KFK09_009182 [Dendrobium nobile]
MRASHGLISVSVGSFALGTAGFQHGVIHESIPRIDLCVRRILCTGNGWILTLPLKLVYVQLKNLSNPDPPYKLVAGLNCVVLGCANIWDLDRAYETFEAIAEKIGLTPDIHSYNALMCAFGKVKMTSEACKVFEHLVSLGVKPKATTYTLLVDAHLANRDPKAALLVIDEMATEKSCGFGFIIFKNMKSTQKAMEEPSKLIDGRLAVCNLTCERLSSAYVSADVALRKVYIRGLSPDISIETLLNFFRKHGKIEEGLVTYDRDTNISRGFWFVTYKSTKVAKKAIADPNKILAGRSITVKLINTHHKGKLMQTQVPATVVPIAIPILATYPKDPKSPIRTATAPVAYASYMYNSSYVNPLSHYLLQSQVPYPHVSAKEPYGIPSPSPTGISGYPYYFTKH